LAAFFVCLAYRLWGLIIGWVEPPKGNPYQAEVLWACIGLAQTAFFAAFLYENIAEVREVVVLGQMFGIGGGIGTYRLEIACENGRVPIGRHFPRSDWHENQRIAKELNALVGVADRRL
jgi:hypothetical protein